MGWFSASVAVVVGVPIQRWVATFSVAIVVGVPSPSQPAVGASLRWSSSSSASSLPSGGVWFNSPGYGVSIPSIRRCRCRFSHKRCGRRFSSLGYWVVWVRLLGRRWARLSLLGRCSVLLLVVGLYVGSSIAGPALRRWGRRYCWSLGCSH